MRSIFTPPFRRAFLGNFLSDLSFMMFVHFPGFLTELGAGEAVIGTVASVAAAASILARPWTGQSMDRYGRIPLVRLAAIVRLCATFSFLLIDSLGPMIYVVRAVYTVALAVFFTGLFTYAADVMPPDRRAQGIAWYGLSGMAAATFAAALGGLLIDRFGYTGLFLGMAVVEIGALAVAWTLKPLANRPKMAPQEGALTITLYRPLIPVWVLTFGFGLGYGGLLTFMRTFVDASGLGSVGLYFTTYSATAIVARVTLSWLPDRLGPVRAAYPAMLSFAAGVTVLAFADSTRMMMVAAVLSGFGHAFIFPILGGLAIDRAPDERRGVALSVYTAMFDLGPLLGAPLLGIIIERAGYTPMFLTMASVITVAVGLFAWANTRVTAATPI